MRCTGLGRAIGVWSLHMSEDDPHERKTPNCGRHVLDRTVAVVCDGPGQRLLQR